METIEFKDGDPVLVYYRKHADLGGMPCIYRGEARFRTDIQVEEHVPTEYKESREISSPPHVPVHSFEPVFVLEVNDGSTLYIPQSEVWFGRLPDMETYEKIKKDKLENEELARITRRGQLEQLRQMTSMQRSGIVGGRMV